MQNYHMNKNIVTFPQLIIFFVFSQEYRIEIDCELQFFLILTQRIRKLFTGKLFP